MGFQQHRKLFLCTFQTIRVFFFLNISIRSRRPVPSLNNPMGNSNSANTNFSQTFLLGNGNLSNHQNKKSSALSSQTNPFPFLSSSTNQNKYSNMQTSFIPSMTNQLQRTPMMTNFLSTSSATSSPPPTVPGSSHMLNGNDMDQNFPPLNVCDSTSTKREFH